MLLQVEYCRIQETSYNAGDTAWQYLPDRPKWSDYEVERKPIRRVSF